MAGSNTLAKLSVQLNAESSRLTRELEKAERRAKRWEKKTTKSVSTVKKAFIALGVGLAAIKFTRFITAQGKAIDQLAKTADKLGLTTEALAGLRHAADLTGIKTTTLDMALQRMTRRLSEAAIGTGEAQGALKELGLDAKALADASPEMAFSKIAKAMENVTSQSDRVRLSFKLFDSEGVALVQTLALGEKGLHDAAMEAEALGLAINRTDALKIEKANNAFTRLKGSMTGMGNIIAVELAEPFETVVTEMVNAQIKAVGFRKNIKDLSKSFVSLVGNVLLFTGKAVNAIGANPLIAELGLVGYAFLGKKGLAVGVAIGAIIKRINRDVGGTRRENYFSYIGAEIERTEETLTAYFKELNDPNALEKFAKLFGRDPQIIIEGLQSKLVNLRIEQATIRAEFAKTGELDAYTARMKAAEETGNALGNTLLTLGTALRDFTPAETPDTPEGEGGGGDPALHQKIDADQAALEAGLNRQLDTISEFLMTREERELESHNRRLFIVEDAFQEGLITSEAHKNKIIEGLEKKHQTKMLDIGVKGFKAKLSITKGLLTNLASLMDSGSRKEFEIGKLAAKGTAIIKGIEAMQSAYAAGSKINPYVGAAYAAAAFLVARKNVAAIDSQSYGGGGSITGGGAGISAGDAVNNLTDVPSQEINNVSDFPTDIRITVEGGAVDEETAERIAESLRNLTADGGRGLT